ncbi:DUF4129 domain-containing protein [Jonesiaceae bacterium BS-20]|uniref:DUF4129 domain-containing protein n=1 Tax=Jonesiaceae bacterium BS-20 TaxID=3120821 RepID=A0AAU7DYZ5_9MICO
MSAKPKQLLLAVVCCALLAGAVTLSGPLQIQLPPPLLELLAVPPVAEVEPIAPIAPPLGEERADEGGNWIGKSVLMVAGLIFIYLFFRVSRRGLALLNSALRNRSVEVRSQGQGTSADPESQVLMPLMHHAAQVGQGYLRSATTSKDAIISAWLSLENAAKEAGTVRDPAQTPTEFTLQVLSNTPATPQAIEELLALYQQARFTSDPLIPDARTRALAIMSKLEQDFVGATHG